VLAAAGFGLLTFALVRLENAGLDSAMPAVGGAAVLAMFLFRQRTSGDPLLPLGLLRRRALAGANLAVAANAGGFTALMFLSTLHLQQRLGFTPLQVGLAFVPLAISSAAGGLLAPRLIARLGTQRTAVVALALAASSFGFLAHGMQEGTYTTTFLPAFLISGFGFAAAFVPLAAEAMATADPRDHGIASGLFQTSTHLGGAFVLAALATIAAASTEASPAAFLSGAAILATGTLVAARTIPPSRCSST
jgi:predicted MFS family arabinose efflux permease